MIQLNLLPDIKLEYIRAQRLRRLMIGISVISVSASLVLLVVLLGANAFQKSRVNKLTDEIAQKSARLASAKDADKIVTVQNQLDSLQTLHDSKPNATRLFDYLNQTTPGNVSITELKMDFSQNKMSVSGTAGALSDVNKYIDTLKYTQYETSGEKTESFSNVVLSSFGLTDNSNNGQPAAFNITFDYASDIFDNTKTVKLIVPNLVTTRTSSLFKTAPPEVLKIQQQGGIN